MESDFWLPVSEIIRETVSGGDEFPGRHTETKQMPGRLLYVLLPSRQVPPDLVHNVRYVVIVRLMMTSASSDALSLVTYWAES